jgi:hypothetical protein
MRKINLRKRTAKKITSDELSEAIKEYLKKGGKITKLENHQEVYINKYNSRHYFSL